MNHDFEANATVVLVHGISVQPETTRSHYDKTLPMDSIVRPALTQLRFAGSIDSFQEESVAHALTGTRSSFPACSRSSNASQLRLRAREDERLKPEGSAFCQLNHRLLPTIQALSHFADLGRKPRINCAARDSGSADKVFKLARRVQNTASLT